AEDALELVANAYRGAQPLVRSLELRDQLVLALHERVRDSPLQVVERGAARIVDEDRAAPRARRQQRPEPDSAQLGLRELALERLKLEVQVAERPHAPLLLEEQRAERLRQAADLETIVDVAKRRGKILDERVVTFAVDLQRADPALRLGPLIDQLPQPGELRAEAPLGVGLALDEALQVVRQLAQRRRRAL